MQEEYKLSAGLEPILRVQRRRVAGLVQTLESEKLELERKLNNVTHKLGRFQQQTDAATARRNDNTWILLGESYITGMMHGGEVATCKHERISNPKTLSNK